MTKQILRFAICVFAIALLAHLHNFFSGIEQKIWYFDKYQHAFAGVILMIGFFDAWKRTALSALIWLLIFNLAWESYEAHAYFDLDFTRRWFSDTLMDAVVTIGAGMHWFYLSEYLAKRKK